MPARHTQLLMLLLLVALLGSLLSYRRMQQLRREDESYRDDLAVCRRDLADLAAWGSVPSAEAVTRAQGPELSERIRRAATAANVADKLVSVEPGQPTRATASEYQEMPVFLRFESLSLQQLSTYLAQLAENDPESRTRSIELEPPQGLDARGQGESPASRPSQQSTDELWTADVTISYLMHAPTQPDRP